MANRPLEDNWPSLVDSTGAPDTGTKIKKATFDEIHDAIDTSIYHPSHDEGPPEIIDEVVLARDGYPNLDDRLDAIAAAAAGGGATTDINVGGVNCVPNDAFLIWGAGIAAAPSYWAVEAGLTSISPLDLQGYALASHIFGRNAVQLVNPDTTPRDFYVDLVPAASLSTHGAVPIRNAKVAAGAFLYSGTPNAVDVSVFDGVTEHKVGEQGSTVNAWVWSGSGTTYDGGATLGPSAAQLTLRVTIKAAATVWVASPALVFGSDTLPRWPGPCPTRRGEFVWGQGDDGVFQVGHKVRFYPSDPIFVYRGRLYLETETGSNTFGLTNDDANLLLITNVNTVDSGWQAVADLDTASVSPGDRLAIVCGAADASARQPSVIFQFIEYLPPLEAAFGGGVVIPVS
jgi:hypothetical protein